MSFFDTSNFMRQINFDFFLIFVVKYAHEYDKNCISKLNFSEAIFDFS